ncbi:MAG: helix-turn-helix domain-containing protein [Methanobrevibacter sp.]|jgi:DNA-binding NarL/FixJ family response regulator|nr:helix-turn-helix domain-containing protein [Candidatus Methanovirga australis]
MSNISFKLDESDKKDLEVFVKKSKEEERVIALFLPDKGMTNVDIGKLLDISHNTVINIKKRYLESGWNLLLLIIEKKSFGIKNSI